MSSSFFHPRLLFPSAFGGDADGDGVALGHTGDGDGDVCVCGVECGYAVLAVTEVELVVAVCATGEGGVGYESDDVFLVVGCRSAFHSDVEV